MMSSPDPDILAAALAAHDAGLCVIRARTDGTKAPFGKWEQCQHQRPSREEVAGWFGNGHPGLGVVCGNVSGDAEMFELEGRFMAEHGHEFKRRIAEAGLELLFQRLINGYQMESPKGGRNFLYRVDGPVDGNTKLARDADNETLIETRGEGGFIVLAPSHGPVHPSGKPWKVREGSIDSIPTITPEEREALFAVARSFDEAPEALPPPPPSSNRRTRPSAWSGGQVGESWYDAVVAHLAATEDMQALLERHGWVYCYTDGRGRKLLRRPGKDEGVSGSINEGDRFCPFSTSVPFASGGGGKLAPTYDALDVLAVYEHSGDRDAAARHIAEQTGILDAWKAEQDAELRLNVSRVDPETGEITFDARNLPDEFWSARPELRHIRQAAHSRIRSADAVLLVVLTRLAATIPPQVVLPAIVGSEASLNMLGAIVADSGGGKSTAGGVAKELTPIDRTDVLDEVPPGSGEGLIEMFFEWVPEEQPDGKTKKIKRQTKTGAYVYLDEGQALSELGNRKGATLLPTLRTAWSGGTLGQQNAAEETKRRLPAHKYRLAMVVGFQVDHAAGLLDDAAGGTPQRFAYASANDPSIPDERPDWPGHLDMTPPAIYGIRQAIDVASEVVAEIQTRSLAATRGQTAIAALDSHADLVRLKVAALFGYLDNRLSVTTEDWGLAGVFMRTSNAVRSWITEAARQKAATAEMASHKRAATRETVVAGEVEKRTLGRAARVVARRVHRSDSPLTRGYLSQSMASRDRSVVSVDEAIEEAERREWIVTDGDLGWVKGREKPS